MKQFSNILKDETLRRIDIALSKRFKKKCWGVSTFLWDPQLNSTAYSVVAVSPIYGTLKSLIIKDLSGVLPSYESIKLVFHIWFPGSAIKEHDDYKYAFTGTIYLNKNWDADYGGLLTWKKKNDKEFTSILPIFNTFVLNEEKIPHMVTPIILNAEFYRVTIQVFAR